MFGKTWLRIGICLFVIAALLGGVFVPAAAAGMSPKVSVIGVTIDSKVQIQAMYLPVDTSFAVRMGKSGSKGVGGPVVANVKSNSEGIIFAWVEILTDLKGKSPIDLRLEGGGVVAYTSFDNSEKDSFEAHMVLPAPGPFVIPPTGPSWKTSPDRIMIKKVEKHGYVVAGILGLEMETDFKVYVSAAGKTYSQGYPVGGLKLSKTHEEAVGTFEIPHELYDTLKLTIHVVGPNYTLSRNFTNEKK